MLRERQQQSRLLTICSRLLHVLSRAGNERLANIVNEPVGPCVTVGDGRVPSGGTSDGAVVAPQQVALRELAEDHLAQIAIVRVAMRDGFGLSFNHRAPLDPQTTLVTSLDQRVGAARQWHGSGGDGVGDGVFPGRQVPHSPLVHPARSRRRLSREHEIPCVLPRRLAD